MENNSRDGYKMMKTKNGVSISKVFLLFIIVYFSCNSFVLTVKYDNYATTIMAGITVLSALLTLQFGKFKIPQNVLVYIAIGILNIFLTALVNGYLNAYFLLVLNFILSLAYIRLYSKQEFYESYICVMKILSVFSIFVCIINIIAPGMLRFFPIRSLSYTQSYYDIFFAFQTVGATRINGIWGEPGMYSLFLIFALIFEAFFVNRKINNFNYILFVSTIVLTFSTNGIICLVILLITLAIAKGRGNDFIPVLAVSFGLVIIVYLAMKNLPWFAEQIEASANKLDQENISFIGRVAPVFYNLKEGALSPLWGHGIRGGAFWVDFLSYSGKLYCNTSTTTFLFASFGIGLSAITVLLTARLVNQRNDISKLIKVLLFIIIMINVNTQAVHLDQIYYLILFSAFMQDDDNGNYLIKNAEVK